MPLIDDYYDTVYEYDQWLLDKQHAEVEIEKLQEEYSHLEKNYTLVQDENGVYIPDYDTLHYMEHIAQELDERLKDYMSKYYV